MSVTGTSRPVAQHPKRPANGGGFNWAAQHTGQTFLLGA